MAERIEWRSRADYSDRWLDDTGREHDPGESFEFSMKAKLTRAPFE
jgi:hypothetical protein